MNDTYENIDKYTHTGFNNYNYYQAGILRNCMPKVLFKGNSILVTFLQLIDLKLILIMKYIDRLKRFKYISWY